MLPGRLILSVLMVACVFSVHASAAQVKPAFSDYEYHVTNDGAFGLYKPKGWKVGTQRYPNGKMVFANGHLGA